jgi:hypothetical protein
MNNHQGRGQERKSKAEIMMSKKFITSEILPALQGVIPAIIGTCSITGVPNVTYISQVYYVDDTRVALSYQFFNKTIRNVRENPILCAIVTSPLSYSMFKFMLRFVESQSSGDLFEDMSLQLEAIASATEKTGVFKLKAADIYEILSVEKIV